MWAHLGYTKAIDITCNEATVVFNISVDTFGGRSLTYTKPQKAFEFELQGLQTTITTLSISLGQHYVVNSSINEQLASVARVEDGDCVLEIGPGTGALTQVLLDAGATVLAVEKDPHMVIHVRDQFEGIDRLTVLEEDFTKCHIRSHLSPMLESGTSVRNDAKYA